jgi:hypothetical protein
VCNQRSTGTLVQVFIVSLLVSVLGCEPPPTGSDTRGPEGVAQLQPVSGDNQVQVVTRALPQPLEVRVRAVDGTPISGETVVFTTLSGGSFFETDRVVSDELGRVSTRWVLGPQAGEQRARVTLASGSPALHFRAMAIPDSPTRLELLVPDSAATPPALRLTFRLSARAVDAHGNAVPGVAVRWFPATFGTLDVHSTLSDRDGKALALWTMESPDGDSTPVGDYSVTVRMDDARAREAPPRTIRRRIARMTTREALIGAWTADRWEFFEDSAMTRLLVDVMASGMSGTLNIADVGEGPITWHWREEYRWWGANNGTDIWGEFSLDGLTLHTTVTGTHSELECDWGDCAGPLHGRQDVVFDGTRAIFTGRQAVIYYGAFGPSYAWSRLTLWRQ